MLGVNSFIKEENLVNRPITEGDCGVILRKDGGFQIFSTGKIDPGNMTELQMEQGLLLTALSLCLAAPQLRQMLLQMASDPAIIGTNPLQISLQ